MLSSSQTIITLSLPSYNNNPRDLNLHKEVAQPGWGVDIDQAVHRKTMNVTFVLSLVNLDVGGVDYTTNVL